MPQIPRGNAGPGFGDQDIYPTHIPQPELGKKKTTEERIAESRADVVAANIDIETSNGDREGELALRGLLETMQNEPPETDQ